MDKRSVRLRAGHIIDVQVASDIDEALRKNARYVTSYWGRKPLSLDSINKYKSEDYKMFGSYYVPILFSGPSVEARILELWHVISKALHIILNPTPSISEVDDLRRMIVSIHVLFSDIFYR